MEEFGEWDDRIYCSVELDGCHVWGNRTGKFMEKSFLPLSMDFGVRLSCTGS